MADITVDKQTIWRGSFDTEFATVNIQRVVRLTDDDGESTERFWRRVITPDDDVADIPNIGPAVVTALQSIVDAVRTPAGVARFNARKAEQE